MRLHKKILLVLLSVLLVVSTAIAGAACDSKTKYYTVSYDYNYDNRVEKLTVKSGELATEPKAPDRDGYDFGGWYLGNDLYDFSTPVKKDITLTAAWSEVTVTPTVRLNWRESDAYTFIFIVNGKETTSAPSTAEAGDTIRFKVKKGTFYTGEPTVYANDDVIAADGDVYSYTVPEGAEGTVLIKVEGYKLDAAPITGHGLRDDPYLITSAAQFYMFATSVNSASNEDFNTAYIRLENDIDMGGEELAPIGADLGSTYFGGVFDGNHKKIYNFSLNSDSGVVGLFGYAAQARIENLTVEADYGIYFAEELANYVVGGIVGYNLASDIVGCTFDGDITVVLPFEPDFERGVYLGFLGGIAGYAQGYSTSYSANISYCTMKGDLAADINPLYAMGGIVGSIIGTDEAAPVVVNNCVYVGSEIGGTAAAKSVGGIVGDQQTYTAVANCYSEGKIKAATSAGTAFAGGLVGLSQNETSVTFSYSVATCSAKAISDENVKAGDVVGARYKNGAETTFLSVDGRETLIHKAYLASGGKIGDNVDVTNFTAVKALLGWADHDWDFVDGKPVPLPDGEASVDIDVTFNFSGEEVTGENDEGVEQVYREATVTITEIYVPIYMIYGGNGMNTFVSDSDKVSFGYFLDAALTERIPAAMPLTQDMTVYVGFADYSEVAGEYSMFIRMGTNSYIDANITLNNMGMLTMQIGGQVRNDMFVYDGERILIRNAYFANFFYERTDGTNRPIYADFYATLEEGGVLTIFDNYYYNARYTEEFMQPLKAYKKNAVMGEWYTPENLTYTFFAGGTGYAQGSGWFSYTLRGDTVTLTLGTTEVMLTLDGKGRSMSSSGGILLSLDMFDEFTGKWEGEYGLNLTISFDGKGMATYGGSNYEYTVENEVATLENGMKASFNASGFLVLNIDGNDVSMGREGSYIGAWIDTSLNYMLVLGGINRKGYGTAADSNGASLTYSYDASKIYSELNFYERMGFYGDGYKVILKGSTILSLGMYTPASGAIVYMYEMTYIDQFRGTWNAEDGTSLEFNGYGGYDFHEFLDDAWWIVEGWVTYTPAEGEEEKVRYYFDRATGIATFTLGVPEKAPEEGAESADEEGGEDKQEGTVYTAVFNLDGTLTVTPADGDAVAYLKPDAYYGNDFQSADGSILHFNGKSNVGLGKATVTTAEGEKKEYEYTLEDNVATLVGEKTLTASLNEKTRMLDVKEAGGGTVSYGMYTSMFGKTYSSGDLTFSLNGVPALDGYGTVTFFGEEVEIIMDSPDTFVLYLGMYTYFLFDVVDENTLAMFDSSGRLMFTLTVADGWGGTYTAANGDILELDGKGLDYYFMGTAILTLGGEDAIYTYQIEGDVIKIGKAEVVDNKVVLKEVLYVLSKTDSEGATAFIKDGVTFYLAEYEEPAE